MPKVFVTQIPHKKDTNTGAWIPTLNINPASEHGEIIVMMPPNAAFHATADLVKQLKEHLKDYNYEDGDSLVALGDPSVIGVSCAILGKMHGKFIVLKWDNNMKRYFSSHISV